MELPKFNHQRRHDRVRADMNVLAIVESPDVLSPFTFRTENVSLGGLFIRGQHTSKEFAISKHLRVYLFLFEDRPDQSVELYAEIVHVAPQNGFGLKIIDEGSSGYRVYAEYLATFIK